jgi:hypothetical protein
MTIVDGIHNPVKLFLGNPIKGSSLWKILPDKPVRVFIQTALPVLVVAKQDSGFTFNAIYGQNA